MVKPEKLKQTAFRLPPELLKRIDRFAKKHGAQTGLLVTRTSAVRVLLTRILDQEEGRRVPV